MRPPDGFGRDSTFGAGRPAWLGRLGNVRNVVRQEMISRQLDRHLPEHPARVLDVGAGPGPAAGEPAVRQADALIASGAIADPDS